MTECINLLISAWSSFIWRRPEEVIPVLPQELEFVPVGPAMVSCIDPTLKDSRSGSFFTGMVSKSAEA